MSSSGCGGEGVPAPARMMKARKLWSSCCIVVAAMPAMMKWLHHQLTHAGGCSGRVQGGLRDAQGGDQRGVVLHAQGKGVRRFRRSGLSVVVR